VVDVRVKILIPLTLILSLLIAGCAQVKTPQLGYGVKYEVKVIDVIDGDTIEVQFQDRTETVRILGIDTPEIVAEKNKPYEYKTSNLECLADWGLKAKEFTSMLNGKTVQIEFDEKAGLRDKFGRLLAYVYINGEDFGEMLVEKGYARVYVEGEFSKETEYLKAEERAFNSAIGVWSCRVREVKTTPQIPQVKIYKVNYNAPGNDRYNLNGEYVVIKNYGDAVNLKGWKLRDEYGHTYVFPSVVIPSGGTITIYTGSGIDTQTELYWRRDWPVWNNDGDTAYLYDSSGRLVDSYSWRGYESQPTSPTPSYNNRGLTEEGKRYIATAKIVAILLGGDTVKIKQKVYSYGAISLFTECTHTMI